MGGPVYIVPMNSSHHQETAPVLRIFGDHADRVAKLLHINPLLMCRVTYAPRSAIHSIGAFLHLSPLASQSDIGVATLLEETDPRDLLRSAMPNAPKRLYRALDRAGDLVLDKSYYERLGVLCVGPLSNLLLSGGSLSPRRLDRLEALLEMDPVIVSLPGIWDQQLREIEAVNVLIMFLRAHRVFDAADFKLPKEAGLPAVLRNLQQALDRIEAPAPGFSPPPPYRIIRTLGEMRGVGKTFNNCLKNLRSFGTHHWFRLASGEAIYVATDAPPMLAALRRVGPDLWHLDEVEGPENADVFSDTKEMLINAFHQVGVRLVRESPAHALRTLGAGQILIECEDDDEEIDGAHEVGGGVR
jgi:hypothetical protein